MCVCVGMSDREPIVCNAALFAVGQFSEYLQVCYNLLCDLSNQSPQAAEVGGPGGHGPFYF